uniref:Carboxylic ester hydrolase n=1 Tax=Holotrichia parallela TaxID=93412 RepID=A0A6G7SK30_HOLPA|nr:carboxylesterase 16 [Holotrichia parallela]
MKQLFFIIIYLSTYPEWMLFCKLTDRYLVTTKNGAVEGTMEHAVHTNKTYYAYRGIPFAEPPVGELRFEPPEPVEDWPFILDATVEKDICLQTVSTSVKTPKIVGSEDCLYLNIYTPRRPDQKEALAVMVWIHGGGFYEGDNLNELYAPDYLINEDVVLVAIAYRLGIFGFFSTGDLTAPGNNGLRDQILGLRWVKENIEAFGGDPNKITIFGESAGGASVSFLTQTPLTKGLYNRAIMQSGLSHCLWAVSNADKDVNGQTAVLLGLNYTSTADLKEKLKDVDYKDLLTMSTWASLRIYGSAPLTGLAIAPVIEPEHPNAIITKEILEKLRSGDFNLTPLMMGFNSMEAVDFVISPVVTQYLTRAKLESSSLVPDSFNIKSSKIKKHVGNLIKKRYFGDIFAEIFGDDQFLPYFSDVYFIINIIEAAQLSSKYADVYLYQLSYLGTLGYPLRSYNTGVGHAEDLNYLFYRISSPKTLDKTDVDVSNRMVRLWANFAKYGNPTPQAESVLQEILWPKIDKNLSYLDINESLEVKIKPRDEAYRFWMKLYDKYRESV